MITKNKFKNHIINRTLTLDICKEWIGGGGDINIQNYYGRTALICVSSNGYLEVVKYLVEKGAKIDIQDIYGFTALIYTSYWGHLEIVKLLVEKGAKIDIQDEYSRTALYYQLNNIQGIKIFLQSKQYLTKIKGLKRKNISFNHLII